MTASTSKCDAPDRWLVCEQQPEFGDLDPVPSESGARDAVGPLSARVPISNKRRLLGCAPAGFSHLRRSLLSLSLSTRSVAIPNTARTVTTNATARSTHPIQSSKSIPRNAKGRREQQHEEQEDQDEQYGAAGYEAEACETTRPRLIAGGVAHGA